MNVRVLVLEDEALLAFELAEVLTSAGFTVVGPATSTAKALDFIARCGCEMAVLDVNLGKETSEVVALTLKSKSIPFVVVSGNSINSNPAGFAGAPFLPKPVRPQMLVSALRGLATGKA